MSKCTCSFRYFTKLGQEFELIYLIIDDISSKTVNTFYYSNPLSGGKDALRSPCALLKMALYVDVSMSGCILKNTCK